MNINQFAQQDYERAMSKGFWRKILTWISGESNELLPFDEVREKLKIQGQRYAGLQQIPINLILGSVGRYRDFDRIFLPKQRRTKDRWVNIDKAYYEQIPLPPVDLYQIGEIYFVKDGNHRVSVARERGQEFVDAYVTVVDIPVWLTAETRIDDLDRKKEHADFILKTKLPKSRPSSNIETTSPGAYTRLFEHIDVHRWYLGEKLGTETTYEQASASWYDQVYLPVVEFIHEHDLLRYFSDFTETDLYLWIMEYAGYLQQAYKSDDTEVKKQRNDAAKKLISSYHFPPVKKVIQQVNKDNRINQLILRQERTNFLEKTRIIELRPDADITLTIPGKYDQLFEHIAVHRWYLGEQRGEDVPYIDAVASWYENVYLPIVKIIRDQDVMSVFSDRTESDLYLWIINRQRELKDIYGEEIPIQQAIKNLKEEVDKQ
jgi:hypothetical protein